MSTDPQTFVRSYASGALHIEQSLAPAQSEPCIEQEVLGNADAIGRLLAFVATDELLEEALRELVVAGFTLGQEHPKAP